MRQKYSLRKPRMTSTKSRKTRGGPNLHDSFYKLYFGFTLVTADLLRYFVPSDLLENLDFSTLERYPDTFINRNLHERREDLIWRVRSANGNWYYIYILMEFQSKNDPWMASRIDEYVAVFNNTLIRSGAVKPGEKLPLILPIVIYNGASKWTAPQSLSELQEPASEALNYFQPQQRYLLIDIARLKTELLKSNDSLPTRLFRLERVKDKNEMLETIKAISSLFKSEHHEEISSVLCEWLKHVGLKRVGLTDKRIDEIIELEELGNMLETTILRWEDELRKEGEDKGRMQERIAIAKNLASINMDEDQIATMTGLSREEVRDAVAGTMQV